MGASIGFGCYCSVQYRPDITNISTSKGTSIFQPDSASIAKSYKIPEWFKDAKLGIFIHWGGYAVPAFGSEWYALSMYDKNNKAQKSYVTRAAKIGYRQYLLSTSIGLKIRFVRLPHVTAEYL